jgi:hypothetical protein
MDVNEDFSNEMPVEEVAAYLADKKATAANLDIINDNEMSKIIRNWEIND